MGREEGVDEGGVGEALSTSMGGLVVDVSRSDTDKAGEVRSEGDVGGVVDILNRRLVWLRVLCLKCCCKAENLVCLLEE